MPPRKRAAKPLSDQDPNAREEEGGAIALQKPNLPRLRGTPSSRRQYTYGSGAEPLPPRPGAGRYDQPIDLGNAVQNVLNRQEEEDERARRAQMPPPPRPPVNEEDETDELAEGHGNGKTTESGKRSAQARGAPSFLHPADAPPQRNGAAVPEDMSVRSFGTESDVFGDATILSSPQNTPVPNQSVDPRVQSITSEQIQLSGSSRTSSRESSEVEMSASPQKRVSRRLNASQKLGPVSSNQSLRRSPRKETQRAAEAEGETETIKPRKVTMEAVGRMQLSRPEIRLNGHAPRQEFASHHSEQDDAIQQDIEETESRASSVAEHSPWRDRWMQIKKMSPFRASTRRYSDEDESTEVEEEEDDLAPNDYEVRDETATDWARFIRPTTYLQLMMRFIDSVLDRLYSISESVSKRMPHLKFSVGSNQSLFALLVVVLLLGASLVPYRQEIGVPTSWNIGGAFRELGGRIRSVPFPFTWKKAPGLWDLGDEGLHEVEDYLKRYDQEFDKVRRTGHLHSDSIRKLQSILPSVVHMELRDGKPVVSEAFWHAIRDLVRGDDHVVTVETGAGGVYQIASDRRWEAIAAKLSTDPIFKSQLNSSLKEVESRVDKKVVANWNGWIKGNDEKIRNLVASMLDQIPSNEEPKQNLDDAHLEELIKKHIGTRPPTEEAVVVTRDEFLHHLKNEFATHKSEIRSELEELRPRLENFVRDTIKNANIQPPPSTLTREEITSLVHGLLRKALAELNIEALASGRIHSHWDFELKNAVNYFGPGAGATVNGRLSSATFDPFNKGVQKDYSKGFRGSKPFPPIAAIEGWFDEGDCWCATHDINRRGNPHGAMLAVQLGQRVIPQHIVLEHILPGATTDPKSRPREVEIHAEIDDPRIRERVLDFSATHFPESHDWNSSPANLPRSFVKIGHFVYEGAELHGGMQLHRLSSELESMGAATDQVVVRAISNYGAPDHTCFYRVRLFGKQVDG